MLNLLSDLFFFIKFSRKHNNSYTDEKATVLFVSFSYGCCCCA